MRTKQLSLTTDDEIKIEHGRFKISVAIESENDEILGHYTAAEICEHFDHGELLDAIGEGNCREHFDITE